MKTFGDQLRIPVSVHEESRERFLILDLARCFAIAVLLFAHVCQTMGNPMGDNLIHVPYFFFNSLGGLAVTMFLVLSGAVLELQYGRKHTNYVRFIARRLLRIYPVYYAALVLGIFVYCIRQYHESGRVLDLASLGMRDIALSITGSYAFAGQWGGPFVGTSWFIGVIVVMYLLFPLLSREIEKRPFISISIVFVVCALSRVVLGAYEILPGLPLGWFPLCRVFEFALGIYLVVRLRRSPSPNVGSFKWARIVSAVAEISFPLFLVHYPLGFLIRYLMRFGVDQLLAVALYIVVSLVASWFIVTIDRRIPRELILAKLSNTMRRGVYGVPKAWPSAEPHRNS